MLSYRHSFHAGNFADVLKHLVLINILGHLNKKPKPWCGIDTHAGPGDTILTSSYALKNREFDNGIGKLWQRHDLPAALAQYVESVRQLNADGELHRYPGSPLLFQQFLRESDRLFLYELHPSEIPLLSANVAGDRRIKAIHGDGLAAAVGLLPPKEHRGVVLIDPAYEVKDDYRRVVEVLLKYYQRFATGTFALWYPVVDRKRNQHLELALQNTALKNVHLYELGIQPDSVGHGMTASGMIVVNPPWTLAADMHSCLPYLADVLGIDGNGSYRISQLLAE